MPSLKGVIIACMFTIKLCTAKMIMTTVKGMWVVATDGEGCLLKITIFERFQTFDTLLSIPVTWKVHKGYA